MRVCGLHIYMYIYTAITPQEASKPSSEAQLPSRPLASAHPSSPQGRFFLQSLPHRHSRHKNKQSPEIRCHRALHGRADNGCTERRLGSGLPARWASPWPSPSCRAKSVSREFARFWFAHRFKGALSGGTGDPVRKSGPFRRHARHFHRRFLRNQLC